MEQGGRRGTGPTQNGSSPGGGASDVVVVGAGNAALSAAFAAREGSGIERVVVLEKAPRAWVGGNSYFTAGATRTTYDGLDDLRSLLAEPLTDQQAARTVLAPYTPSDFRADMERLTEGSCDPDLTDVLVNDAADAVRWLSGKGVRYRLQYDRQSFEVGGEWRFFGNLPLGIVGGGKGLVEQELAAAESMGIEIRYEHKVVGLLRGPNGAVSGVTCETPDGAREIRAAAVVLAAGGFQADPDMRRRHLGEGWEHAKVRGTPYNTGEVLRMALDAGAQPYGHWAGSHAIQWDAGAPETGDRELTNLLSRQSYPLCLLVNRRAERFLDEGADLRNYTYAKYGREILKQPGGIAYQLFDARTVPLLRQDEYTSPGVTRVEAATVRALAEKLGVDPEALERTVGQFNAAVQPGEFNPAIKDGKGTRGVTPTKSNWALPLDTPPFVAFPVTCGITFTFGGLRIDRDGRVLDQDGSPLPGLHAAGELVGGLFHHNYPGGSGLAAGTVFGRRAGRSAAEYVRVTRDGAAATAESSAASA